MTIRVTDRPLTERIDAILEDLRPARYFPDDEESSAWLDEAAKRAAAEIERDIEEDDDKRAKTVLDYARSLVGAREGQATKRANQFLRESYEIGQIAMWFARVLDCPLAIRWPRADEPTMREERVKLRNCSSNDLRQWAAEERRDAAAQFAARNDKCSGAEMVADQMDDAGFATFGDFAASEADRAEE